MTWYEAKPQQPGKIKDEPIQVNSQWYKSNAKQEIQKPELNKGVSQDYRQTNKMKYPEYNKTISQENPGNQSNDQSVSEYFQSPEKELAVSYISRITQS